MGDSPIGYGRPPKGRPFQPGQSGNLLGRPKRTHDLGEIVQKTLNASMPYRENGKPKIAPRREVAFKSLVERAKKGDVAAADLILKKRKHALRRGRKGGLQFVVTEWLPDPSVQMGSQEAQNLPMETEDPIQESGDGAQGGQDQNRSVNNKPTQAEES